MPSGHKAFLVHNSKDLDLLLMHNRTYAAEYVTYRISEERTEANLPLQDLPQRFVEEACRHRRAREAVGCEGYERQGQDHDRVISGRSTWTVGGMSIIVCGVLEKAQDFMGTMYALVSIKTNGFGNGPTKVKHQPVVMFE